MQFFSFSSLLFLVTLQSAIISLIGGDIMIKVSLIEEGKVLQNMELYYLPRKGDVISSTNIKAPHYLVNVVEHVDGHELVNLHVQEFANQVVADNEINGFRNNR